MHTKINNNTYINKVIQYIMKTLYEFLNESTNMNDNIFVELFKLKTKEEFKARVLDFKSQIISMKPAEVDTEKASAKKSFVRNDKLEVLPTYKLSSANANKFYVCIDDGIEYDLNPIIYFGNDKKIIKLKWNSIFNDVGWDKTTGKRAVFTSETVYELPDDLIDACKNSLKFFK